MTVACPVKTSLHNPSICGEFALSLNETIYLSKQPSTSDWVSLEDEQFNNIIWYDSFLFIVGLIIPKGQTIKKLYSFLRINLIINIIGVILINLIKTVVGFCLTIILLPIAGPIVLIFKLISELTKLRLFVKYGPKAIKAAGIDAIWGLFSQNSKPFITALVTMSGQPDIEKIRNIFNEKILNVREPNGDYKYIKLRQDFGKEFGYFRWKDTKNFQIENHIKLINLADVFQFEEDETRNNKLNNRFTSKDYAQIIDFNCNSDENRNVNRDIKNSDTEIQLRNDSLLLKYLRKFEPEVSGKDRPQWELLVFQRTDNR